MDPANRQPPAVAPPVKPSEQPFMLATLAERAFSRPGWLYEIKYDGVRVLASRDGADVELRGRSGQVITGRYPEITAALQGLPIASFVIDGEIVALDEDGRSSFQKLQARMGLTAPRDIERAAREVPVTAIFFDCLAVQGYDLRGLPLTERKDCLRLFVPPLGTVRYGDHVLDRGEAFFEAASVQGLEGIVAKKATSRYVAGRSRDWIKIKCHRRQQFVIGGYTDPQGSRGYFGALHLGLYEGGRLVYVSKVGTGFDEARLAELWAALQPLAWPTTPFAEGSPAGHVHHWVEPRLVCEVRFSDWTRGGGIRHPLFVSLRPDTRPEDCRRERSMKVPEGPNRGEPKAVVASAVAPPPREVETVVKITNPLKVFWPDEGYTKGDLIAYYDRVAALLLPYLRDRPLVLTRYPDGIRGKAFFQHDAPEFAPSWVRRERIYSKDADRQIEYFVVSDARTLSYVVNLGTIPLHLWSSRFTSLDRPDWLVLDLDPKGAPFTDVVEVARRLHQILDDLELPSYVKTSGATGLHVLVPLGARYSHEEARTFARLLAMLGVEAAPRLSTIARPIQSRGGKVYIDFGQNGSGRTIVAPYSVRPVPGATVSCPLDWSEVTDALDPARFTIETVPERFRRLPDPLAPVLFGGIDMGAALTRLQAHVGRAPRANR
jgi:bifunctional non-homologous end joining protein LigD